MKRIIKITGSSGSGILTVGELLIQYLSKQGWYVCADREYPSLIKGGKACYHVCMSDVPVRSLSNQVDIIAAVDRTGSLEYIDELKDGSMLIFGDERFEQIPGFCETITNKNIQKIHLPERKIPNQLGAHELMYNMIILGALGSVLGGDLPTLEKMVHNHFSDRSVLAKLNAVCLRYGFIHGQKHEDGNLKSINPNIPKHETNALDGNKLIALAAIHHGVKNYFAYPMSPSSTILQYLLEMSEESGMTVKQVSDEISAIQMCIGSMYVGSRALCATSGGGFDLMTESISLAAMTETPLVIINAQRPGPATGLPTWTAQADLNISIYSGHGEFARVVLALSDHETIDDRIGQAYQMAERFNIPVIILTDKVIADTKLVTSFDSKIREDEISKPQKKMATILYANGDEHGPDGKVTEEADAIQASQDKRREKMEQVQQSIPKPRIFGRQSGADISFVGWGSSLDVMQDIINLKFKIKNSKGNAVSVNYLHFDFVWPLETTVVEKFFKDNKNVHLIEGNVTGQLGTLIEDKTGVSFAGKFLKYNGRRFYRENVESYVEENAEGKVQN